MRKLISAFAIGLSLLLVVPTAFARDPDVPFPLDFPLPFPWGTIEGIWEVEGEENAQALFSFEVLYKDECADRRILKVVHVNSSTGEIYAHGSGISVSGSNLVRAGMAGDGGSYMLFVGAFEDRTAGRPPRAYTLLKIRAFTNPNDPGKYLKIRKISSLPIRSPEVHLRDKKR